MPDVNEVHPVILPKTNLITEAIVPWCHENMAHSGRSMTLNNLKQNGLWVISTNSFVRRKIFKCVTYPKLRGVLGHQKIYQKIDALKHHHSFAVEWMCLDLLLSEKEDQI